MRTKALIFAALFLILMSAAHAQTRISADVTRLGVGARLLGMGKMFTGYADDVSAMFLNPAGLANIESLQLLTMSGRFVNTVEYLTMAAASPIKWGTLGVGYVSADLGFYTPKLELVEVAPDEYRIIPSSTEVENYQYSDKAVTLSYAFDFPQIENLSLGTTLKLFNERIIGSYGAYSVGTEMDVSMIFEPTPFLSFGITQQNVLPYSLGGGVRWNTGYSESIPTRTRVGSAARLAALGDVVIGLDYDFTLLKSDEPGTAHMGAEWWPNEYLALRGGVDQDVIGSGGSSSGIEYYNNTTLGLSLLVSEYRFDYAYHTYNNLPNNDTHYFSLAYGYQRHMPKIKQIWVSPEDKTITRDKYVTVEVYVKDVRTIRQLMIGNNLIYTQRPGTYEAELPLKLGKNLITVRALDYGGRDVEKENIRILRLRTFTDVPYEYWARKSIEDLGTLGLLEGFPDGTYLPENYIRRIDLMMLVTRLKGLREKIEIPDSVNSPPFKDIPVTHWAATYAKVAKEKGISKGYPDGTFKPNQSTTRLEGILMVTRFAGYEEERTIEKPFADIPGRHWGVQEVTTAKYHGLLNYLRGSLGPSEPISRAEIAELVSQTPLGKEEISKLYDFETGY